MNITIRPPAVAGMFYPGEAASLERNARHLLEEAQAAPYRPKAILAPHAGYVYSGPIAASAYVLLQPLREIIRRVVLLGPVHRVWVQGLAVPGVDAFETPLGRVPLDWKTMASLLELPQVEVNDAAHATEHSLEVQLPFLQMVLADFTLLPLVVGGASARQVAEVLDLVWGGEETLIVISSDLSHYLSYEMAREVDQVTVEHILALHSDLVGEQACGAHPLNGLLLAARQRGLRPHLLDLRNSGDTAGDKQQVVGYAAVAFTEGDDVH